MDRWLMDAAGENDGRWSPSTTPIGVDSFREVVDDHPILVVHAWAEWDRHDPDMDRILREVIPPFEEWIEFRSFDVDADREGIVTRSLGIANVPALVCYLHGQRFESLVGVRTARELAARFEGWLAGRHSHPILYGPGSINAY